MPWKNQSTFREEAQKCCNYLAILQWMVLYVWQKNKTEEEKKQSRHFLQINFPETELPYWMCYFVMHLREKLVLFFLTWAALNSYFNPKNPKFQGNTITFLFNSIHTIFCKSVRIFKKQLYMQGKLLRTYEYASP